jgi:hypothetical protein
MSLGAEMRNQAGVGALVEQEPQAEARVASEDVRGSVRSRATRCCA